MKLLKMQQKNKIIFDVNSLVAKEITGIGTYTRELLLSLAKANPETLFIGHYFGKKALQKSTLPSLQNIEYKNTRIISLRTANILRRIGMNIPIELLARTTAKYAFYPAYLTRGSITTIRNVVTVHDMAYLNHKETLTKRNQLDLERLMPKTVKNAYLVICISNATKTELKKYYDISDKNILVQPVPPRDIRLIDTKKSAEFIKKIIGLKKYFLFVGTIEPRKNIENLINAFALLPKNILSHYSLIIVGGEGWKNTNTRALINSTNSSGASVKYLGFIPEHEKIMLYSRCEAFVSASLEEGFCIPILEAAQFNRPSILSNIPVFHEVARNSALYFDEKDPEDICNTLMRYIKDDNIQTKLSVNAGKNLKLYSWEKIASEISSILKL